MNESTIIAILTLMWGLFVTIFFMSAALRAARAHEKLAQAIEDISKK